MVCPIACPPAWPASLPAPQPSSDGRQPLPLPVASVIKLTMATHLCGWQVRQNERTNRRAGLLMTVVKWGKVELFNRVVDDSNFEDQRSPALVQQAFQLGLKLAGNKKDFDVKLIELLLQHNANPADVFMSDLFRLVGPGNPNGVVDDAFGYLASLEHSYLASASKGILSAAKDGVKRLSGASPLRGSSSNGSPKKMARMVRAGGGDSGGEDSPSTRGIRAVGVKAANAARRISRGDSLARLMSIRKSLDGDEDKATQDEKKSLAEASLSAAADEDRSTSPWQRTHLKLMNKLIPG